MSQELTMPSGSYGLNQSHVILGFTGSIGSGCTYIAKRLAELYSYKYYKLSEVLREELREKGNLSPSIKELQDYGNELRKARGCAYLIERLTGKINAEITSEDKGVIIDSIKNVGEVDALKMASNFFLISVHADRDIRTRRLVKLGVVKQEDFDKADRRDQLEDFSYGQQVKRCDYISDIIILNNEDIPKTNKARGDEYVRNVYSKYIEPVEIYSRKRKSLTHTPTVDELCMTVAYSLSKMSSCLKRRVGAVIANQISVKTRDESEAKKYERHVAMPIIVSTGYNDVPLGRHKCIYDPEFMMCYRDFLQQQHAGKLKFCPNCGSEIKLEIKCQKCGQVHTELKKNCMNKGCGEEIDSSYVCKCGTDVFKDFLPGSKNTPGKLLDMCRALHAEEMAIINLKKTESFENLTLYTTTQPCNLCANKIVSAGIKRVVFTEPYAMPESSHILKDGGVAVERFQGIKSVAFFKLYQ